ncbi:MAG: lamin tail domain-containing protein [Candidatus Moraniibacteriota bacterium]
MPKFSLADGIYDIVIEEVLYDPGGADNKEGEINSYEWIKLKNVANLAVDIRNWELRAGKYYKAFVGLDKIPVGGDVIIYLGTGVNDNLDFTIGETAHIYLNEKGSKLGDSFGEIALYNNDSNNEDTLVDYVLYKKPNENKDLSTSYKHAVDARRWLVNCGLADLDEGDILLTVDNACRVEGGEIVNDLKNDDDIDENKDKVEETLKINELLPSPKGNDDAGEYIELYNFGKGDINLGDGWWIEDRVGAEKEINNYNKYFFNKYTGEKSIGGGEFLVIKGSTGFNFSLSASDEIRLVNPGGLVVDKIDYTGAKEGVSYSWDTGGNKWRWSQFLTPGDENQFGVAGEMEVNVDKEIYKNIYALFEVRVAGIKQKNLKVKWEFGDGKKSYQAKVQHKYNKNGKYIIKLTVFDGNEEVKKEFNVTVVDFPEKNVSILAINPNPKGKDELGEWIEIKNKEKKKINLKNWSLATGESRKKLVNHPIYEDFIIKAGKVVKITRKYSNFSLNNKRGYLELRYPSGEVAYKLKYEKSGGVKDDEIYRKKESSWQWFIEKTVVLNDNVIDEKVTNPETSIANEIDLMEVEEVEKKPLFDEIEVKKEDVGKYSQEILVDKNMLANYLVVNWSDKEIDNKISMGERYVLGSWDNKIKKIRESEGVYYFNLPAKEQKHYMVKFWEELFFRG